jgi:hypothetical protein|tara:strand:- start:141 stop:386 length:246 start_codon:yes stop_codon:yes gene_type:complete
MRPVIIDKSLEYVGKQISYRVSGTVEQVVQIVKEYQPRKVIFAETSRYEDFDKVTVNGAFVQVYLLFDEEQAMLFRLSKQI